MNTRKSDIAKVAKRFDKLGFLRALVGWLSMARYWLLWHRKPYSAFYRAWQDDHAARDPRRAVGGLWEELGNLQFTFLVDEGLQPQHRLLDIGCGSLRGGLWFIRYLETGNYYGIDISPNILEAGKRFLIEAGLESRQPQLKVNSNLQFDELSGITFDYIIAQSVFTHMPEEDIEECFANLHKILKTSGSFYATFNEGKRRWFQKGTTQFYYSLSFFQELANLHDYQVTVENQYHHPRGQKMLCIKYRKG